MPAAIPLIAGAFIAAGSVATAVGLGTLVVAGLAISWAAVLTVTGVALMAVAYLARKTPKPESAGQQLQQKLDPQAPVPVAYGRTASGGYITWRGAWGKKNAFYGIVTVLSAGGPIQGIESYRAGDYPIGFSGSPAAQLATCNNVGGYSGSSKLYKGKLRQRWVTGAAPSSATPASLTGYPIPAGSMSGLAHSITSFEYNTDAFPQGLPASLWTLNGVKLYDPRKDATYPGGSGAQRVDQPATWTFSENPYLAALQWTLGRYENGKRVYGIGAKWTEVDVASFVNGANVADANGWKVGGVVTTSDDKYAVLASLLTCGSGVPVARGAQIACSVNAPKTAVLTLTKEDIIGEVEISSTTSWRDRQNTIIPRYREESQNWEIISGERLSAATYVAEDGGETKTVEIEFPLVQQAKQAHQLAAYELVNSREFLTFTVNAKMRMLAARVGDAMMVNVPQIAANSIKCTVAGREFNPADLSVTLTLKSETDAKHAYALGQTQVAPPSPKLDGYDPSNPEAPASTAWAITATAIKNDTVTLPAIVVTGATDDPNAATVIFEYRPLGSSEWLNGGEYPRTTNRVELTSVTTGTAYEVAVSYRTNLNVIGERLVLGATAGDMKVDWQTIVDGAGKPDDYATVGAIVGGNIMDTNGNNLGRDDLLNSEGSFNAVATFDFSDNTGQGVTAGGATLSFANGVMRFEPVNTDPIIMVPVNRLGSEVSIIRMVARPMTATHAWQGQVYYNVAGHGESEAFTKKIPAPELVTGKQIVLEWDMRLLTSGGLDYTSNFINTVRIDLEQSTAVWEIDFIQLGNRAGSSLGAPTGTIVHDRTAEKVVKDLNFNADSILEQILRGDSFQSLIAARTLLDGKPVNTVISEVKNQSTLDNAAIISTLALIGAKNANGDAFIIDAASLQLDDGKALGTTLSTITADFGGVTGSIDKLEEVLIDPTGATVRSVNKLDSNGYISGTIQTNNGTVSEFNVIANKFKVVDPTLGGLPQTVFAIENGEVTIPNATVGRLKYSALVPLLGGNQNQLNANAGYQIFPGGFIMQWGRVRQAINAETTFTVTFPMPFPGGVMSVVATPYLASFSNVRDLWLQNIGTPSLTQAVFATQAASNNDHRLDGFDWISFGF